MPRLASSDPSTLEQQRLMKRLMVWGGILIALMILWYLIIHGPFRKMISNIPEPQDYTYGYATPEVVAAGIARPPAGYEWMRVREWTGTPFGPGSPFYQVKGASAATPKPFLYCAYSSDTPVVPTDIGFRYVMPLAP